MALARAIIGDASDNIPGVKGVGFKTLSKKLDFLAEDKTHTIDDVINFCSKVEKTRLKFYNSIVENKSLIEHNYKMMQLYVPQMSVQSKTKVKESVENFESNFNKTAILKMMRDDGFGELNWSDLNIHLSRINRGYLDRTTKVN